MDSTNYRGRIAPTPSGFLHIGHAKTFAEACARAKAAGGKIVLRIEDIDSQRSREEYISQIYLDLKKFGIRWDEGPDIGGEFAPYIQSERKEYHWQILKELWQKGLAYPCNTSRQEIKKLSKKSECKLDFCENETIFPVELRAQISEFSDGLKFSNWRFKVPDNEEISFTDLALGSQTFKTNYDFGDFLIWRKTNEPSYELAVVADDIAMEISEVVRGKDLLLSTARQILIYRALGKIPPNFAHCELITDADGKKLSKSNQKND